MSDNDDMENLGAEALPGGLAEIHRVLEAAALQFPPAANDPHMSHCPAA
jgi:hypothetical protein